MKKIPLNHGLHALVDDEDFEKLNKFKWIAVQENPKFTKTKQNEKWYPCSFIGEGFGGVRKTRMTRIIMGVNMPHQNDFVVHHRDGDSLDCRKENLKLITRKEIMRESAKHREEKRKNEQKKLWAPEE